MNIKFFEETENSLNNLYQQLCSLVNDNDTKEELKEHIYKTLVRLKMLYSWLNNTKYVFSGDIDLKKCQERITNYINNVMDDQIAEDIWISRCEANHEK